MISIRKATEKDVASIVSIHQKAFPDFFLTTLGERFLKLYYDCMCKSHDAVTLCADKDGAVVGFSTCAYTSHGFNKTLIKKNLILLGQIGVGLLLTRPGAISRLVKKCYK